MGWPRPSRRRVQPPQGTRRYVARHRGRLPPAGGTSGHRRPAHRPDVHVRQGGIETSAEDDPPQQRRHPRSGHAHQGSRRDLPHLLALQSRAWRRLFRPRRFAGPDFRRGAPTTTTAVSPPASNCCRNSPKDAATCQSGSFRALHRFRTVSPVPTSSTTPAPIGGKVASSTFARTPRHASKRVTTSSPSSPMRS